MHCCFIANSSWYLKNFRESTISSFLPFSDVTCLSPDSSNADFINKLGASHKKFFLDKSSVNPFKEITSLVSVFLRILLVKPDIVFSFNPKTNLYSLMVCYILRIPCVPNVSGVGAASQVGGISGKMYNFLVARFYNSSPCVFFQNRSDLNKYIASGWVKPEKARVLPGSGVDLKNFSPCEKERDRMVFLMAVRLIKAKGVEEYLAAARLMQSNYPDCQFLLAGLKDTSARAVDDSVIADIEDEPNIFFLGHVQNMPELLKTVDCVVLPSYYPEGVPRNLIEAAAAGKVIITTDTPGCREVVVDGDNGYLVETRSVEKLFEAMQRVARSTQVQLESMKSASRRLAESRFDEAVVIQQYIEVAQSFAKK